MPLVSQHDEFVVKFCDEFDAKSSAAREIAYPATPLELARNRTRKSAVEQGHEYMREIRKLLAMFDKTEYWRTPDQVIMQEKMLAAAARYIYGADYATNQLEIKAYNRFDDVRQEIFIKAARRTGKSWATAMLLVCIFLVMPNVEICIFSSGSRAAGKTMGLMGIMIQMLAKVFGVTKFEKNEEEHLFLRKGPADMRKIHAFPGSVHTLRGAGGKFIVMEEAAYVSQECFFQVIAPILSPSDVTWIAITTMSEDQNNYMTTLMKSGKFAVHSISGVCDTCIAKGVVERCRHKLDSIPKWSDEGRQKTIESIFDAEGRRDDFLRESMNMLKDKDDCCFKSDFVREIFSDVRRPLEQSVEFVYVAVDPCAGSMKTVQPSEYAIVTICGPGTIILGMDAVDVAKEGFERVDEVFVRHLTRVRQLERTRNAKLVLAVERGTGIEANRLYGLAKKHFSHMTLMRSFEDVDGVQMTNENKKNMMWMTNSAIRCRDVRICQDFVSENPDRVLKELQAQLLRFKTLEKGGDKPFTKKQVTWSGKGSSMRERDDLACGLQWAVFIRNEYLYSGLYDESMLIGRKKRKLGAPGAAERGGKRLKQ